MPTNATRTLSPKSRCRNRRNRRSYSRLDMADDLAFATITELNAQIKARKVSAVELTKLFSQRLETLGPGYNALALALTKGALKKAKEVDGDLKRERFRGP